MQRIVEPEILDALPEQDPAAIHNRRDMRIINALMGNFTWFARTLVESRFLDPGAPPLELGAGRGDLALFLKKKLGAALPGYTALDLASQPEAWPVDWTWLKQDLLDYQASAQSCGILGNLILHQFEDDALARLGERFDRDARWLLFCEPARRQLHIHQLRLGAVLNFGEVTRHDGPVSIRAGFLDYELPKLLRLDTTRWEWRCSTTFLGAYRMIAWRK